MQSNLGILYIMTTVVDGLLKIGICETKGFEKRMRELEKNGYNNITGLKRFFAIEVEDYSDKETLLKELFNLQSVGNSEIFSIESDLIKQLLLAFQGKVIYPKNINDKEKLFEDVSKSREENKKFNFLKKGMNIGDVIVFKNDSLINAKVVDEREVEYDGQIWKLSPLAHHLYERAGKLYPSGAYQGAAHFKFNGKLLKDLPNI